MTRNTFLGLLIVVLLVIGVVRPCQAKIYGVVKGRVIGEDTGAGVPGVQVRIFYGQYPDPDVVKTDANGNYLFKNVEPGFYTITFEPPYDSGYYSMPAYNPRNTLFVDKERGIYKELELEFTLGDGETKTINKILKKGTKVWIKTNVINTDQEFNPETFIYVRKKEKSYMREEFFMDHGYQKVFPAGEKIVISGKLRNENLLSIDLKREFEIIDTELQEITIDFDMSTCLEIKIIKPPNYLGTERPHGSIFNYGTDDLDFMPIAKFYGFEGTICGFLPGKYEIYIKIGLNQEKKGFDYRIKRVFEIAAGHNSITVEMK